MTRVKGPRLVQEITRRPPRLARGYLAETYDGIGQYVMVTMSRGAITSAFRARIAAGDFGGGRTFPAGTPIVVFSNRGQLEVFLGNIPITSLCDPFDRVETNSWGEGPLGDWELSGYFSNPDFVAFHVENGEGKIDLVRQDFNTDDPYAVLNPGTLIDGIKLPYPVEFQLRLRIKTDVVPYAKSGFYGIYLANSLNPLLSGNHEVIEFQHLNNATSIEAMCRINGRSFDVLANDDVLGVLPNFHNRDFFLRVRYEEKAVRGRFWFVDDEEPTAWTVEGETSLANPELEYFAIYAVYQRTIGAAADSHQLVVAEVCDIEGFLK